MKQKSLLALLPLLAAIAALPAGVRAAPLTATTAVQARPAPEAPAIAYLKAGSEPVPAPDAAAATPPGWTAVVVPGPFEAYVLNRDLTKSLEVRPGSSLYLLPKEGSPVLATAARGDKTTITGLRGKWTRVRLERNLVGFIQSGPVLTAPEAGPAAPPPVLPAPEAIGGPGKPAQGFGSESVDASAFPRVLEGQFVSTSNLLPFHKPYAWQLVDEDGNRRAYLDISRLLQTSQMDRYVNRQVVVSGTLTELPNGKDMVVVVESLNLK
jgi:hypothetical protein